MKLFRRLKKAKDDDSGAVTVDWVVLAAATVIMGSTVISTISPNLKDGASQIGSAVVSATEM